MARRYPLKPGTVYVFRHEAKGIRCTKLTPRGIYEGPGSTGMFTIEVDEPTDLIVTREGEFVLEDAPPRRINVPGVNSGGRSRMNGETIRLKRAALIKRDGPGCCQCGWEPSEGEKPLTIDHIVRQADGGTHALSNLRLMCEPCHVWHHWDRRG